MSGSKAAWARRWRDRGGTWWWAIVVIVVPVALIATAAVTMLLLFIDPGSDAKNRIELIKVGLTIGAGTGGVVALVLTGRRQWSTEHDNAERRLTELYVKAVEQLGSDKPAVRHGGLYALERVAQDNPYHRQVVVDVICAYLRTPFQLPGTPLSRNRPGIRRPMATGRRPVRYHAVSGDQTASPTVAELNDAARQEREVRLTAQRILSKHLKRGDNPKYPAKTFWKDISLDLTGATLINFDLLGCQISTALFDDAAFHGTARFNKAAFHGRAEFSGAVFHGRVQFYETIFYGEAWLDQVTCQGEAQFRDATFHSDVWLSGATFHHHALLGRVTFHTFADFSKAAFHGEVWFGGAAFHGGARFAEATFHSRIRFDEAAFHGGAQFRDATFHSDVWFDQVTFHRTTGLNGVTFHGDARFVEATFDSAAVARGARVHLSCADSGRVWPLGWTAETPDVTQRTEGAWTRLVPVPIVLASPEDDS